MPVVVQHLTQPSDQDRQDLLKIYADAPDWLLAPFPDAGELVERGLADGLLFTGRFNDRLLGAAWIERDGDTWRLSRLCVRQVTRDAAWPAACSKRRSAWLCCKGRAAADST